MRDYVYNGNVLALAGLDLHPPNPNMPGLIRQYNAHAGQGRNGAGHAARVFGGAGRRRNCPSLRGDFNSLFTGCFSARILLKQRNRELETKLFYGGEAAGDQLGQRQASGKAAADELEEAWEPVLFNQQHDLICGSHVDASYERACDRYKRAAKQVGAQTEDALDALDRRH